MGLLWCTFLLNFKVWKIHGMMSLCYTQYGKAMGMSLAHRFCTFSFLLLYMGKIWDFHKLKNP